ncbi:DarT ssDNA thymidine ADP-ribosyltransferase family protein [Glaciihabitans sp. dw_435]|uniref:DarT ssDNA thymidine ADP-ribosyltransferase family protein n=1 Tax=Glaciihabitans sp. dw_435 TaxID=2720081 RepID=UPI001BD4A62B|nr:DarT ssDNA thymidine ADP-ribosyltransferase family protein [Glaciihabitans sp. dw_435]
MRASSSRAAATRAASTGSLRRPVADIGEQRIYHLTHVDNLAAILESGALLADLSESRTAPPAVDISSAETRETRRSRTIEGSDTADGAVASYVPFFLSPNASVWDGILSGADDPRLSVAVRGAIPADYVMLVSTIKKAVDAIAAAEEAHPAAIVATNADAAATTTSFGATREDYERIVRRLRADSESPAILEAEFLVKDTFPIELVTLIGVANDKARDVVRPLLRDYWHTPKVAVYPPWFHRVENDDE